LTLPKFRPADESAIGSDIAKTAGQKTCRRFIERPFNNSSGRAGVVRRDALISYDRRVAGEMEEHCHNRPVLSVPKDQDGHFVIPHPIGIRGK